MEVIQRKVQFRQGSYVITIPTKIAGELGIKRDQYVTFIIANNKLIIRPTVSKFTSKDLAEVDKATDHLHEEKPSHMIQLEAALKKDRKRSEERNRKVPMENRARLEKLMRR